MMRLILDVSLRRWQSFPKVFIQGLLALSPWARSLSTRASETSAQWNPALSRHALGTTKDGIRNF
jgi:hypothetical protein